MKAFGCRGIAARVVTESFAVSAFCDIEVIDVTARYAGPDTDAVTDCAPANAAVRTAARMPQIASDTRFLMSILLLPGSSPCGTPGVSYSVQRGVKRRNRGSRSGGPARGRRGGGGGAWRHRSRDGRLRDS